MLHLRVICNLLLRIPAPGRCRHSRTVASCRTRATQRVRPVCGCWAIDVQKGAFQRTAAAAPARFPPAELKASTDEVRCKALRPARCTPRESASAASREVKPHVLQGEKLVVQDRGAAKAGTRQVLGAAGVRRGPGQPWVPTTHCSLGYDCCSSSSRSCSQSLK